jgi:hypothetical protein
MSENLLERIIHEAAYLAEMRVLPPNVSDAEICDEVAKGLDIESLHPHSCGGVKAIAAYRNVERMVLTI